MIGEKERLYILAQKNVADRTCAYASDFCTSVNYLGKLQAVLEILKIFIEVVWDEIKEGLRYYILLIQIFYSLSHQNFATI